MPQLAEQLELFPVVQKEKEPFKGRAVGALGITTEDRFREIGRLIVLGYKTGEIATTLQLSQPQTTILMKEARARGYVDILNAARNSTIKEMRERRGKLASRSYDVLQKRLDHIHKKGATDIDSRDMDDAFKALDITEYTHKEPSGSGTVVQTTGPVAVFSQQEIHKAAKTSDKLLGDAHFNK